VIDPPVPSFVPWSIEFRWKEEVVYWEGDRGCIFQAGWGVTPGVTYVPDAASWDEVVPVWLVGRRDEIVTRLRGDSNHVVEEADARELGYGRPSETHRDS